MGQSRGQLFIEFRIFSSWKTFVIEKMTLVVYPFFKSGTKSFMLAYAGCIWVFHNELRDSIKSCFICCSGDKEGFSTSSSPGSWGIRSSGSGLMISCWFWSWNRGSDFSRVALLLLLFLFCSCSCILAFLQSSMYWDMEQDVFFCVF